MIHSGVSLIIGPWRAARGQRPLVGTNSGRQGVRWRSDSSRPVRAGKYTWRAAGNWRRGAPRNYAPAAADTRTNSTHPHNTYLAPERSHLPRLRAGGGRIDWGGTRLAGRPRPFFEARLARAALDNVGVAADVRWRGLGMWEREPHAARASCGPAPPPNLPNLTFSSCRPASRAPGKHLDRLSGTPLYWPLTQRSRRSAGIGRRHPHFVFRPRGCQETGPPGLSTNVARRAPLPATGSRLASRFHGRSALGCAG